MTNTQGLLLFDVSGFPVVRPRTAGHAAGYGELWTAEMDAITGRAEPFVLLIDEPQSEESHDDRKAKSLWLKANRALMASLCRGFIVVEPDEQKRVALKLQGLALAKPFGLNFHVAADIGNAELMAARLLRGEPLDGEL
jgi:hypothetical protein